MTVFTKMSPFILIRDRRLVIDYSTYGNLSDQLNLCPSSLSHSSLPNSFNLNSFREEKNCRSCSCCAHVRFRVESATEM